MFGKHFSRHFEIFFLFFLLENRIRHFMQTVSLTESFFSVCLCVCGGGGGGVGGDIRKITSICRLLNLPTAWLVLKQHKNFHIAVIYMKKEKNNENCQ